ncbi:MULTISPECIES: TetR/AcrR family transcriptional regulator [unclassified Streptomyces]|uniref:TetR/AcrR family transcriptional regulator n=1 Tax=unclassified Streptomyces TaxID=2593676 RepID=UPI000DB9EB3C|nr:MULTISPECIES: TetR/AcrR family transcriptional regulator [unclassified Streptomyces]MYT70385.1 TetR family transcriptional regulator [Streptomyces sp. SID8367]RAJ70565.1 TetR family transcriptional regulator [Streptomyces sp. PsTaAH-137]
MPRITAEKREANRARIVAAARRCFSRDGFHQTSVPDIAAEAGLAVGALYRYFGGKDEIILEIAGDAFRMLFAPVERLISTSRNVTVADLVSTAIDPVAAGASGGETEYAVPDDELLRCAVQAWGELLRSEALQQPAESGFEQVRRQIADALRAGQETGSTPAALDPDRGARVVMALLHGFVLQRTAFGLEDMAGFARDARLMLGDAGLLQQGH